MFDFKRGHAGFSREGSVRTQRPLSARWHKARDILLMFLHLMGHTLHSPPKPLIPTTDVHWIILCDTE